MAGEAIRQARAAWMNIRKHPRPDDHLNMLLFDHTVEKLFSPDLIVVGGGISKEADQFLPRLKLRCPIVPAQLRNQAGIIGAARLAVDLAT